MPKWPLISELCTWRRNVAWRRSACRRNVAWRQSACRRNLACWWRQSTVSPIRYRIFWRTILPVGRIFSRTYFASYGAHFACSGAQIARLARRNLRVVQKLVHSSLRVALLQVSVSRKRCPQSWMQIKSLQKFSFIKIWLERFLDVIFLLRFLSHEGIQRST